MTDTLLHALKATVIGVAGSAGTVAVGVEAGFTISEVVTIATGIGMVVSAVVAIDSRMDKKLDRHTKADESRHQEIMDDSVVGRQQLRREMKAEFKHLREMLAFAGVIPDHTPDAIRLPDETGRIPPEEETQP